MEENINVMTSFVKFEELVHSVEYKFVSLEYYKEFVSVYEELGYALVDLDDAINNSSLTEKEKVPYQEMVTSCNALYGEGNRFHTGHKNFTINEEIEVREQFSIDYYNDIIVKLQDSLNKTKEAITEFV